MKYLFDIGDYDDQSLILLTAKPGLGDKLSKVVGGQLLLTVDGANISMHADFIAMTAKDYLEGMLYKEPRSVKWIKENAEKEWLRLKKGNDEMITHNMSGNFFMIVDTPQEHEKMMIVERRESLAHNRKINRLIKLV